MKWGNRDEEGEIKKTQRRLDETDGEKSQEEVREEVPVKPETHQADNNQQRRRPTVASPRIACVGAKKLHMNRPQGLTPTTLHERK